MDALPMIQIFYFLYNFIEYLWYDIFSPLFLGRSPASLHSFGALPIQAEEGHCCATYHEHLTAGEKLPVFKT